MEKSKVNNLSKYTQSHRCERKCWSNLYRPQVVTADVLDDAHILILHTVSLAAILLLHTLFGVLQPVQMFVFLSPPAGAGVPLELLQQSLLLAACRETGPEGPGSGLLPGPAAGLPHSPGSADHQSQVAARRTFLNLLNKP